MRVKECHASFGFYGILKGSVLFRHCIICERMHVSYICLHMEAHVTVYSSLTTEKTDVNCCGM